MDEQEIQKKLFTVIENFKKQALAYCLNFEGSERKISREVRNRIHAQYGKESFSPVINWYQEFGDQFDSDILDNIISDYLSEQNYEKESFVIPKDRLKNMLWNLTRSESKKIMDELIKNE